MGRQAHHSQNIQFLGVEKVLMQSDTQLRLFAKPEINGCRRLGVVLNQNESIEKAVQQAVQSAEEIKVIF